MLTLHDTRRDGSHRWFSLPLALALVAAVALAMLAVFAPLAEATSPPPTYSLWTEIMGTGTLTFNPSNGPYSAGTVVEVTAVPGSGWLFDHWESALSGDTNPGYITMDSNKYLRAVFVDSTYYTLTTAISPSSSGYVTPNWGSYTPGSQVQIAATPYNGYRFGYWTGNPTFSSTDNPATVTLNSHQLVTANFIKTYTLTTHVGVVGTGGDAGSIQLTPSGGVYDTGTVVTVQAVPNPGWRFYYWSGDLLFSDNPETLTMTSNKIVTGYFKKTWALSTTVIGQGAVSPAAGTYDEGAQVQLTATPATNWRFKQWSGDASGTTSPVTVVMDANKAVTAKFVTDYTLSLSTWREGSVDPGVGDHVYESDQTITVTATPDAGTRFDHWEGDVPPGQNPESTWINVPMDQNRSLMAVFIRQMTIETSIIGQGSVSPASATVDQDDEVTLTATPATDWVPGMDGRY